MTHSTSSQDTLGTAVQRLDLPRDARLLLAVSGGPDSVALLDTIARLAPDRGWSLRVGHVNHSLRGEDSDADERFVRRLAESYRLPIEVERADVAVLARATHCSLETAARDARYRALRNWLRDWPGDAIVTGHTRDDQAETVLLRLFRGAGTVGLGGMRSGGTVLRPFLTVDRSEIRRYLHESGLSFRDDGSNRDRRFRRNALRLDVMPAVLELDPSAQRLIARTAEHLQTDADYILAEAHRAISAMGRRRESGGVSASRAVWRALHPALRRHTLRLLLGEVLGSAVDIDTRHIVAIEEALLRDASVIGRLPHNLQVDTHEMRFAITATQAPASSSPAPVQVPVPGAASFGNWSVTAVEIPQQDVALERAAAVRGAQHALLDAGKVRAELLVRGRRPGDRIHPPGMTGSRKVQDIMVDNKVAAQDRDQIPLIECGEDVIWVAGSVIDRRYAATASSERLLHLSVKPEGLGP